VSPTSVGAGTYYPVCFDATNVCYGPTPNTGVSVTINRCTTCNAGSTAPTLSATSVTIPSSSTTASLSGLVSSTCPSGSALEWHTVRTGLSAANKVAGPTSVGVGTYYPVCFDATNVCYGPTPTTGVSVIQAGSLSCPSNSLFNLSGLAVLKDSYIQLTPDATSAAGQAWSKQAANLGRDFTIKFKAFFGNKDGGNGIAFLFRNPRSASSGQNNVNGLMGYALIRPSFAVEFDTQRNTYMDIDPIDETSVIEIDTDVYPNSTAFQTSGYHYLYNRVGESKNLGNIEDNAWHNCEIKWNATTKTISVMFDGRLVNQAIRDIVKLDLGGNANAVFGFTANTDGLRNQQSVCVESVVYDVCNSGTSAPILSTFMKTNVCPSTTVNLSGLVASSCPTGSSLEWHTLQSYEIGMSPANKVANPTAVGAGTYYPVCFDAINSCYSSFPDPGLTVIINNCGSNNRQAANIEAINTTETVELDKATVFPNPSSGKFSINLKGQKGDAQIVVTNIIGNIIQSSMYKVDNNTIEVDLSNQSSGMYLLNITIDNKNVTKKLILEK
ncbi:lectin-like domain-containing protein, partial [Runella salmonicolor]